MIDIDRDDLRKRWHALWTHLDIPPDRAPTLDPLVTAYDEPQRAYHNLRHIIQCLHELDGMRGSCDSPDAVELAIWYHDAVYDPTRQDNEERSAELAVDAMKSARLPDGLCERVVDLILVTKHAAAPTTQDAKVLIDIDLSVLGQEPEVFDEYERGIRREYGYVDENAFREGRAAILEKFLARPTIFSTPQMRDRYEEPARRNLARSIARLRM